MQGDLHVHTRESDGSLTAKQVVLLAKNSNIDVIAITNHDCFINMNEITFFAQEHGVNLIEGIEISSYDTKRKRRVHILCYLPKQKDQLMQICDQTTANRVDAGLQMTHKVAKLYPITVEDIIEIAKDSRCIYKQHITKALMNAGFTTTIFGELFEELFNFQEGSCIVNCKQPNVFDVLEVVKSSGGVCVMAHPFTYNSIEILDELIDQKLLDGIEVWSSKSTQKQEDYLLNITKKHDLIATGGSDFHGSYSYRISPIGIKSTPADSIEAIYAISKQK